MKRTYIVKQEKKKDIFSVAQTVANAMLEKFSIDFADKNGWSDADVFDISLTDRYWEIIIKDNGPITLEEANYKFEIKGEYKNYVIEVGLKEVYIIM